MAPHKLEFDPFWFSKDKINFWADHNWPSLTSIYHYATAMTSIDFNVTFFILTRFNFLINQKRYLQLNSDILDAVELRADFFRLKP